jgi:hypothetical protein
VGEHGVRAVAGISPHGGVPGRIADHRIEEPSTKSSRSLISAKRAEARRESVQPGSPQAATRSMARPTDADNGRPEPSQRDLPTASAGKTSTVLLAQPTPTTHQLRPPSRITMGASSLRARLAGCTEPSSARPCRTARSIGLLKAATTSTKCRRPNSRSPTGPRARSRGEAAGHYACIFCNIVIL